MEKYPNIKVKYENVGQGAPHYVKLRDALKAGTGLPDVAQMEFNSIASFRALNALEDMGIAGANDVKAGFVDWTWKSASDGDKVYGIPWDFGPDGPALPRRHLLGERHRGPRRPGTPTPRRGSSSPRTSPAPSCATSPPATRGWICAILWQKGWRPFKTEGTDITIAINDANAKDWADYWQKLIDAKAVDVAPVWTSEWFAGLDDGKYASWVTAAWGPALMASSMKASVGKWRAAEDSAVEGRRVRLLQLGRLDRRRDEGHAAPEGGDALRHLHGRRPGGGALLEQRNLPVPGAQGSARRPGRPRPQVRLLRRPAGQPDLRRVLGARGPELRVRAVPGLCEHRTSRTRSPRRSAATARSPRPSTGCRTPSSSMRPTRATP